MRQALADQQVTIQKLERLVERQGQMLERLQGELEKRPAAPAVAPPAPSASPSAVKPADQKAIEALKAPDPMEMRMKYTDNLTGETLDRSHKIFVGGRLQMDAASVDAPRSVENNPGGTGPALDAVDLRRARFDIGGTLFTDLDFYLQFDFVNGFNTERAGAPLIANVAVPTDAWMQFRNLPAINNLRVGNQKPAIGFEHLISSRFLDLMERSGAFDAFIEDQDNGFRPGISVFNWSKDERFTWALGVFKNTRNPFAFNVGDGEIDVTGRIAGTPYYKEHGRKLLHLGLGASVRDNDDGEARYRTRTLVRNGTGVQHTLLADARFRGHRETRLVPELAYVNGPFAVQAEYVGTEVTEATFPATAAGRFAGDVHVDGYYAQVMYFLTGEHKSYNRRSGTFGRVVPKRNANWGPDTKPGDPLGGAWMLVYRHGGVDLDDGAVQGGRVTDDTLGINWFLNRDVKVQWNYTVSDREAPTTADGDVHSFGTRLAFDF